MLTIDKRDLRKTEINGVEIKDFREIARIYSHNPKYSSPNGEFSVYLIPDSYVKDIADSCLVDDTHHDQNLSNAISEAKHSSGRKGRKVRKKDVEMIRVALEGNIPEEDLESFLDFLSKETKETKETKDIVDLNQRKSAIKSVFKTAKSIVIRSSADIKDKRELTMNDLDWKDKEGEMIPGELVPLPIVNVTDEEIDEIKNGRTIFYIKRVNASGQHYWKKVEIRGDHVEALIEHGTYNDDLVFLSDKDHVADSDNANTQDPQDPQFQKYMPTGEEMIEISYIYGPNRSGKTYYAAKYATLWAEKFKDWPIYLFSRRDKDKVLDDIPTLERVSIDDKLITEPLSMTDFEHSLVIFDDIDTIPNKLICKSIQKLRDDIMETGRQKMIYVINTSHLGMNYASTRTVLNEANSYTLFPRKGNYGHNFKLLKEKMGMSAKEIRKTIDFPEGLAHKGKWGWMTVYKDSPQYLIYENGVKLIEN